MHDRDIHRIRSSHALLKDTQAFGARFYAVLFARCPAARALFSASPDVQAARLGDMLDHIVRQLSAAESLQHDIAELGRRHAGYGVSEDDYDDIGSTLLAVLREFLGAAFTQEVEEAWATLYGDLAEAMIAAGAERQPDSAAPAAANPEL